LHFMLSGCFWLGPSGQVRSCQVPFGTVPAG
jgi:hypothetical protein